MMILSKRIASFNSSAFVRFYSYKLSKLNSWQTRKIAPNLYLDYHLDENGREDSVQSRPLVVLMSWLRAKDKYLDFYNEIYMRRGFDVLTAKITGYDMFYPAHTGQLCLNTLENELAQYESVLVHAFSFGVYIYGTMLLEIQKRKTNSNQSVITLEKRIKGIALDSVVTADLILGLSESLKDLPSSYKLYMKSHQMFLRAHKKTTKYLLTANELIFNCPLPAPALVMVSDSDVFSNVMLSEKIVNVWRNRGIDVKYQRWKNAPHVQLMKYNEVEYGQLIDQLIDRSQVIDEIIVPCDFDDKAVNKLNLIN